MADLKKMPTPLHGMCIIQRDGIGEKGGRIIIPETSKEKAMSGTVIAVGLGYHKDGVFIETTVKPGEHVWFRMFAHLTITVNGEDYVMMAETELAAVDR